jgi:hypothetical protein
MPPPAERRAPVRLETMTSQHAEPVPGVPIQSVFIRVHLWLKQKTHRRVGSGLINSREQSEPDRRAAKQRVQQQVQIQIAIHKGNLAVRF